MCVSELLGGKGREDECVAGMIRDLALGANSVGGSDSFRSCLHPSFWESLPMPRPGLLALLSSHPMIR